MRALHLRYALLILASLFALLGAIGVAWRSATPSTRVLQHVPGQSPGALAAPYVPPEEEAAPPWQYRLFRDVGERVGLATEPPVAGGLVLEHRVTGTAQRLTLPFDGELNLTPHLPERGEFFLTLTPANSSPQAIRIVFTLPAQPLDYGRFFFFVALSVTIWVALARFLLPFPLKAGRLGSGAPPVDGATTSPPSGWR